MRLKTMLYLELSRLFRKSNLLFLFLSLYILLTPIGRGVDQFTSNEALMQKELYQTIIGSISIFGMLVMALFMVNNIGNEFNERSYRKLLVLGILKRDYLIGKLLLVLLLAIIFLVFTLLTYVSLSAALTGMPIVAILGSISITNVFNQLMALCFSALFGLCVISVSRNKTFGLVFFPFWFFTELFVYVLSKTNTLEVTINFLPGIIGWNIYNSHVMSLQYVLFAMVYTTVFIILSWYGFILRDET